MGKRSDFERRELDVYDTPHAAIVPLLAHLPRRALYWDPCAGDGSIMRTVPGCIWATDIAPRGSVNADADFIHRQDALTATAPSCADFIMTNPPWTRSILHQLIAHLSAQRPTWLLFDADWVHTKQAGPYLPALRRIVSIGRVKWIPDSTMTGKDNCAWHLFDTQGRGQAKFYGRAA